MPNSAGTAPVGVPQSLKMVSLRTQNYFSRLESAYLVRSAKPDVVHWLGSYRLPGSGMTPSLVLVNDFNYGMYRSLGYSQSAHSRLAGAIINWQLSKALRGIR